MVVKEYKLGSECTVYIHDDYYKDCTEEEVKELVKRISDLICNSQITSESIT